MPLLLLGLLLAVTTAEASWPLTCACEWNPWTRVTYLSCAELRPDAESTPLLSQQPFNSDSDCRAEAARMQGAVAKKGREPSGEDTPEEVSCDCDWNSWRANSLLSCTAWYGDSPSVRMLDRLPFGGPKGRRGDAEKSCFSAKSSIETFARESR